MPSALKRMEAVAAAFRRVHAGRAEHVEATRVAEALLFASPVPLAARDLAARLPHACDVEAVLADLERQYRLRGVQLVRVAGGWAFRTAPDLAFAVAPREADAPKPSRAAMEVLAIVAYHGPATRAEIEDIRGVATSKGTLDALLASGWVRMAGRRAAPGRPVTFATTPAFLDHFGLASLRDLPALDEIRAIGLGGPSPPAMDARDGPDEEGDTDDLSFAPVPDGPD